MIQEVQMPKLGQTVEEATIETWHKQEGDPVAKGDVLLEITTDKATLEVEAYVAGTLRKQLYQAGEVVPVNATIAFVGDPDDEVTDAMAEEARAKARAAAAAAKAKAPAQAAAPAAQPAPQPAAQAGPAPLPLPTLLPAAPQLPAAAPTGRILSSPRARMRAEERRVPLRVLRGSGPNGRIVERDVVAYAERVAALRVSPTAREIAWQRGVDLTRLQGSGTDGRIMKADVEAAPAAPAVLPGQVEPLTAMRRIVAERLTYSKQTTPHFYLTIDVDMTAAVAFRKQHNDAGGPRLSFNDLIIRACALAFAEVPEMNVAWADGGLLRRGEVNIGLAVALDAGLIVPVVRGCDAKSLEEIAQASAELVEKARGKRLTPDEYEGGCMTVSNLGMFGIETLAPIINPGEVGILGIGRIAPRPVVIDDAIHVRQMTTVTLVCDHRIVDGAIAARWLQAVQQALEAPESLA